MDEEVTQLINDQIEWLNQLRTFHIKNLHDIASAIREYPQAHLNELKLRNEGWLTTIDTRIEWLNNKLKDIGQGDSA